MRESLEETGGKRHKEIFQEEPEGLAAINELKRDVLERLDAIYTVFEEYFQRVRNLEERFDTAEKSVRTAEKEIEGLRGDVEGRIKEKERQITHVHKNIEKIDDKIENIMDEVGYGESMDVSKIPPNILEIVYQSTLDDIVSELWKTLGPGDFERVIKETLEEVRQMTSGSELFRFDDNRRIRTNNLAKSLEDGLISAKQIQTTYDVLLEKLSVHIPYYKPKNFRAMIKIKSQEYTVDKTTYLLKKVEKMERSLNQTNQLVAALSAQLNAKGLQMERVARDMEKKMYLRYDSALAGVREEIEGLKKEKVGESEIKELMLALKEVQERQARLYSEIDNMKAMFAMKNDIYDAKMSALVEHLGLKEKLETLEETISSRGRLSELDEQVSFVYYAVPDREEEAATMAAIAKKLTGVMKKEDVKEILNRLMEENFLFTKKKGKTIRLFRPPGREEELKEEKKEEDKAVEAGEEIKTGEETTPESEKVENAWPLPERPKETAEKETKKKEGKKKRTGKKKEKGKTPAKEKGLKKEAEKVEIPEGIKEEKKEESEPESEKKGGPEQKKGGEESVNREILEQILKTIPEDTGFTMARIRKEAKGIKYTDILMGVKILIDNGLVSASTEGRRTTYRRTKKEERNEGE